MENQTKYVALGFAVAIGILAFAKLAGKTGPRVDVLASLAAALIVLGACGSIYFFLFYDTTLAVPDGRLIGVERVHNIGLMNDRQTGMILSIALGFAGLFIALARSRASRPSAPVQECTKPSAPINVQGLSMADRRRIAAELARRD